jgi:cytochrome P450/O-methyltransferase involved in polyketide biosynthesis
MAVTSAEGPIVALDTLTASRMLEESMGRPHVGRVYDYFLGGSANWSVDREFAEQQLARYPDITWVAVQNRRCLARMVEYCIQQGVRQFVDLGSGIPTQGNVHQIAEQLAPGECRVVYVDTDPVAVAHSYLLLEKSGELDRHTAVHGDLVDAERLWQAVVEAGRIDPNEPVALLMVAVLHFAPDDGPGGKLADAVAYYRDKLAPGSFFALSHGTFDEMSEEQLAALRRVADNYGGQTTTGAFARGRGQIETFFGGWPLVEPGLVWTPAWVPSGVSSVQGNNSDEDLEPSRSRFLAGMARKPDVLPVERSGPYAPHVAHLRLRDEAPISRVTLPSGGTAWALTRHADIRAMLSDPRFSSNRHNPDFPRVLASKQVASSLPLSIFSMDPPEHTRVRRTVVGEFTAKRMAALRPRIQEIVDEHLDAMLAGPRPADLVRALSLPVPSLVICELLGVPYADHEFFQTRSANLLSAGIPGEERVASARQLVGYLVELIGRKADEPGDDLLSRQLAEGAGREDLMALAFLLLVAGHETTANMISLGTLILLEHPDTLAAIRQDPTKTPNAVEELLRYFTIAEFGSSRVAVEDVELGGVLIRAGEGVVSLGNTGNRDPEAFENPDEFDIERGARHHVAFGYGPHQCLGQNLARIELQIVFDTLLRRVPTLRLATEPATLRFKDDANVYGLHELPVTW